MPGDNILIAWNNEFYFARNDGETLFMNIDAHLMPSTLHDVLVWKIFSARWTCQYWMHLKSKELGVSAIQFILQNMSI